MKRLLHMWYTRICPAHTYRRHHNIFHPHQGKQSNNKELTLLSWNKKAHWEAGPVSHCPLSLFSCWAAALASLQHKAFSFICQHSIRTVNTQTFPLKNKVIWHLQGLGRYMKTAAKNVCWLLRRPDEKLKRVKDRVWRIHFFSRYIQYLRIQESTNTKEFLGINIRKRITNFTSCKFHW